MSHIDGQSLAFLKPTNFVITPIMADVPFKERPRVQPWPIRQIPPKISGIASTNPVAPIHADHGVWTSLPLKLIPFLQAICCVIFLRHNSSMKLAYIKQLRADQDTSRQVEAVERAGCENGFQDAAGPKRPALQKCLTLLQPNDTLVIWRLDALGNSLHEVIMRVTEIHQRGIKLLSRSEPLNTAAVEGMWIFKSFAALHQCERNLLIERTQHGMKAARARGIKVGAKPKLTSEQIAQAKALLEEGHSRENVADFLKVSRSTLYRTLLAREALYVPEGTVIRFDLQRAFKPFEIFPCAVTI
jgi:DNA invertase Pin-like site-specific DNA recombinase